LSSLTAAPQLPQNFAVFATCLPQFEQYTQTLLLSRYERKGFPRVKQCELPRSTTRSRVQSTANPPRCQSH
jgi:hypothetical protein